MSIFGNKFILSSISFALLLPIHSLHASTDITSASALVRESKPVIQSLPTPIARAWVNSRIKLYTKTLKSTYKSYSSDATTYRKEVWKDATSFINSLKNQEYTYDISEDKKKEVELTILSYQKEWVSTIREYINKVRMHDTREIGNMNAIFNSHDMRVEFGLTPYTITQTRDMKNIQITGGISLNMSWSKIDGGSVKLSMSGTILLKNQDLYVTLDGATIESPISTGSIQEMKKFLEKIQWKTYHQKLDVDMAANLHNSQKSLEYTEKILEKLETSSLLTPVAQQWDDYILMFRKSTILDLARLTRTREIADVQLNKLIIPVDLRLHGNAVKISGYTPELQISWTLDRDSYGTMLLTLDGRERATYNPSIWQFSRTPGYWAFSMTSDDYQVNAKATKTSAEATVKKWDTVVATANISETWLNAWSYNLEAMWDDIIYNYEDDTSRTDTMSLKIWWALRREFWDFTLTPPTLYEEMSKIQKELSSISE